LRQFVLAAVVLSWPQRVFKVLGLVESLSFGPAGIGALAACWFKVVEARSHIFVGACGEGEPAIAEDPLVLIGDLSLHFVPDHSIVSCVLFL
jgi:hypothetical protein